MDRLEAPGACPVCLQGRLQMGSRCFVEDRVRTFPSQPECGRSGWMGGCARMSPGCWGGAHVLPCTCTLPQQRLAEGGSYAPHAQCVLMP